MGDKRNSIGQNIFHLFYSTALSSAINAVSLILLATTISTKDYGLFSVVLAYAMIMSYFTDAGLSKLVLREGSKPHAQVGAVMSSFIKLRFLLMLATFVLGFLFIHTIYQENQTLIITSYYLIIPLVTGVALQSISTTYFQLIEKMQYSGLIRIVSSFLLILTLAVSKLFSFASLTIYFLYGLSYFIAGCFGMYLTSRAIKLSLKQPFVKGLMSQWWSFMMTGLLFIMLPHLGPIVLENTLSLEEVAFFAVAFRIPQALQQVPFIVAGAYNPVLFRLFNMNQLKDHLNMTITQTKVMTLFGMAMAVPLYHLSESIIGVLFGERWLNAAPLLEILSLLLVLQGVNIALGDSLTTRAMQSKRMKVQAIAVVAGFGLYFTFSKLYGLTGGVYASLFIEAILIVGFWLYLPGKRKILTSAIVPYLFFFFSSLFMIAYFFPAKMEMLSAIIHYVLILIFCLMDRELRAYLQRFVKKFKLSEKKYSEL